MRSLDKYMNNTQSSDFQQSTMWGKVKELWEQEVILLKNNKFEIIASMSVLIRKIPIFGYLMYVPRGPVGNIENKETLKYFREKIDELNYHYHAFVIIIEPNIEDKNEQFKELAKSLGFLVNNQAMNFSDCIQARHNFRLNLKDKTQEEIMSNFSSKTRYNIRLAEKKGITVKRVGLDGLDDFFKLMEITGKRDCFGIRKKGYFKKIMDSFKECSEIYIAYYNDLPLASSLTINYAKKMTYLYGASSNEYRNLMPTYLLQWTMIKDAIESGCNLYDFRGVSMDQGDTGGLYRFKKGFGGDFIELIGEIYIPFKPIKYKMFKLARKTLGKIRHTKLILKNFLQSHFLNIKK
ncbi:MAG: peptidoglycan bridge formation glycyltransferase FemA/FemB family protein [Bacilli bacterium]|nr:peptidoglycan bridge formation glycyltransferase FemA/FemB family protein [Bacilli bacterium]